MSIVRGVNMRCAELQSDEQSKIVSSRGSPICSASGRIRSSLRKPSTLYFFGWLSNWRRKSRAGVKVRRRTLNFALEISDKFFSQRLAVFQFAYVSESRSTLTYSFLKL